MTLSGGQKQRLFIALALIHDPELVFLDELTTGLDPQARRAIWDLVRGIRDRGKTVFLTTHLMEEAERLCDRVAIIDHGRIVDIDSPAGLVRRHCPERTSSIETVDERAVDALGRVAGVDSAGRATASIVLRARSVDVMTGVIACLADQQIAGDGFPDDRADARGRVPQAHRPFGAAMRPFDTGPRAALAWRSPGSRSRSSCGSRSA